MWNTTHIYREAKHQSKQQDSGHFAPHSSQPQLPTPPCTPQRHQDRMPPPTTPMLPSLPVKKSVLHQLGIADDELPHGLACLKHNLLLSPSHTPSQESNVCTNSSLSGSFSGWVRHLQNRLGRRYQADSFIPPCIACALFLSMHALSSRLTGYRVCRPEGGG